MTSERAGLIFVDASGGGLAALAAGLAKKLGHEGAIAATSSAEINVPPEVALALKEIGAELPPVQRAGDLAGIDPAAFAYPLYHPGGRPGAPADTGEGDLERRVAARIARDRIERYLETR